MGDGSIFSHAFNGKLMILFLVILFIACFIIIVFHVYSPWFRIRRERNRRHQNLRRIHTSATVVTPQGLDLTVMCSIPTFIYQSDGQDSPIECAVCLSEFEYLETGRILPQCKHSFHVQCIDMWLNSHSDCPICRTQVRIRVPVEPIENQHDAVVVIRESEDPGVDSGQGYSENQVDSSIVDHQIKQLD